MHFLDKMAHLFFLKIKALRSESVNDVIFTKNMIDNKVDKT